MNRQESFEKAYAEAHGLPLETFAQYRMGDTYRLPMIAKCWRFWNLALDSIDIRLPYVLSVFSDAEDFNDAVQACREAIEKTGVKCK
jgi:hypothetical protein